MLSGILNSDRAIEVNIQIMRTFTKLRHMISANEELKREIDEIRKSMNENSQGVEERFKIVFDALDQLFTVENNPSKKIGF